MKVYKLNSISKEEEEEEEEEERINGLLRSDEKKRC